MTYITSGPSSFDSEKLSSTRTSTHSSLESHVSAATVTTTIQQTTTSSYFIANDTKPSYVSSSESKDQPPSAVTTTTASASKSNNSNHYKGFETTFGYNNQAINTSTNHHSNSSSTHNSNLVKNSLNALCNEAITNNGILAGTNTSNILKLDTDVPNGPSDHQLSSLNETLLSFKLHTEGPPDLHEMNRYNKNFNKQENAPMNNSKTMPSTPPVQPANFFYKNVLKNIQHDAKNICGDLATDKDLTGSLLAASEHQSNLRRSNSEIKKLNSNLDLKNQPSSPEKISGLIMMKKSLSVSSEPNLTNQVQETTTNKVTILVKDSDKPNNSDRRFSFQSKDDPMIEEMYDFPSLTDLSFNFTSLAAQKILQGDASLNSIDTLVELNINQEKQQTIMKLKHDARMMAQEAQDSVKVVTDFGMV